MVINGANLAIGILNLVVFIFLLIALGFGVDTLGLHIWLIANMLCFVWSFYLAFKKSK